MLQAPTPGNKLPTAPSEPLHPSFTPQSGGYKQAGEFTRMLESQNADSSFAGPLAPPPQQRQATGDATRAFQAQMQAGAGAPPPQEAGGPSEFTKMFKAPPPPPPAPAEPKPVKRVAARPPIPKKKTNYVLYGLIGLAVVLALALIIYLIVK